MDLRKIILIGLLWSTAVSCAELKTKYHDFAQSIGQDDRSPGEKMRLSAADVWYKEDCGNRSLPFFRMDQNNIVPQSVRAGDKISHRIEYSMCSKTPDRPVRGRLITSVYYGSRPLQSEKTDNFEMKPGRWVVDTDIYVPSMARPGEYSVRTSFAGPGINFVDAVFLTVLSE